MSILVKYTTEFDLTNDRYKNVIDELKSFLQGKVISSYIFGSLATGTHNSCSDIDLIIITETNKKFIKRWECFEDIFNIFPDIDLLIYTPQEFNDLTTNSPSLFWKDILSKMKKII
ncbi:MAG: nucleotidyltransferase domain-containing protein [Oligoflexia bacterium]|nr:nucleotidyltransferase domain-containing protein [Oligoflexia bacterium]